MLSREGQEIGNFLRQELREVGATGKIFVISASGFLNFSCVTVLVLLNSLPN